MFWVNTLNNLSVAVFLIVMGNKVYLMSFNCKADTSYDAADGIAKFTHNPNIHKWSC